MSVSRYLALRAKHANIIMFAAHISQRLAVSWGINAGRVKCQGAVVNVLDEGPWPWDLTHNRCCDRECLSTCLQSPLLCQLLWRGQFFHAARNALGAEGLQQSWAPGRGGPSCCYILVKRCPSQLVMCTAALCFHCVALRLSLCVTVPLHFGTVICLLYWIV